jgi:glycosyltransferase involved in cell wall biosynthesis
MQFSPESPTLTASISVVICARNRVSVIQRSLEAVQNENPREIIVVDGRSTDGTREVAARFTDRVLSDEGRGLSAARQLGAEAATGIYVAYVDTDVVVAPGTLARLASLLEDDPAIGAAHATILPGNVDSYWSRCVQARMDLLQEYTPGEKTTLGCMAVVIRRDLVLRHAFDSYFVGASEDEDFYYRLRRDGWKLVVGESTATHFHRQTFSECVKQRIWYGRGAVRLALKGYPGARVGLLVHPAKMLGIQLAARAIRAGKPQMLPFIVIQSSAQYAGEVIEAASQVFARLRRQPVASPRESLKRRRA